MLTERLYNKIDKSFQYLINMPMHSVSIENITKLTKERDVKNKELQLLKEKTIETMWIDELMELNKYI